MFLMKIRRKLRCTEDLVSTGPINTQYGPISEGIEHWWSIPNSWDESKVKEEKLYPFLINCNLTYVR